MSRSLGTRLESRDPAERRSACHAAALDPSGVLWIDALCERLGDADRGVARAASRALARLGAHRDALREALIRALRSEHAQRRLLAALTWVHVEPPHLRCLPVLVEGLEYADGDLRWSAARALVDLARLHPEAHGVLLGLARADRTPSTRRMALHALRQLAPDDAETAAALIEASRALEPSLQRSALTALAGLLSPPPAVLERLHEARNAEDPTTRRIAELAIERLAAPRTR